MASAEFVSRLVGGITGDGGAVWLDGGWGVDALLGRETRPHDDVDIVVQAHHLAQTRTLLEGWGFAPVPRDDTRAWNFVLGDPAGTLVDFHVVVFDTEGRGIYGPQENGVFYPADAFSGRGEILGTPVRCMSAAFQTANRTGYPLRSKDHQDIGHLRARFGL